MKSRNLYLGTGMAALCAAPALAGDRADDPETLEWEEAYIFFELNNTDGDLGIHAKVDGEEWKHLWMKDAANRRLLGVATNGRLRRQGLTEIFFESAEPTFDELAPETFFRRFPEGTYKIKGISLDGVGISGDTGVTHAIPAPPEPTINGIPAALQCDDEEPGFDAPVIEADDYVIAWNPVTMTHPSLGDPRGAPGLAVVNYEVVVEAELETGDGEEFTSIFSVILPPDVTAMTIPAEFLEQSDSFKYEVLVREASWNQTAIESCFLTEADD
jgi:hypothetical protein